MRKEVEFDYSRHHRPNPGAKTANDYPLGFSRRFPTRQYTSLYLSCPFLKLLPAKEFRSITAI